LGTGWFAVEQEVEEFESNRMALVIQSTSTASSAIALNSKEIQPHHSRYLHTASPNPEYQ